MANYYFLATLLPPLKVGSPVDIGSQELSFLLRQNLKAEDLDYVTVMRRLIDIENIRALLKKQPIEPGGNLDAFELEEALFYKEGLPEYILSYLDEYPTKEERLEHFSQLLHRYFLNEAKSKNQFLSNYLDFERKWRLVFVVLRAIDLERPLEQEMRYEDKEDPFVQELLAEARERHFEPPAGFGSLKLLYEARKSAPFDLYQALSEWRFEHIEQIIEWETYSLERILGYIAQLELCEKWLELDKRKGLEIAEEMMEVV